MTRSAAAGSRRRAVPVVALLLLSGCLIGWWLVAGAVGGLGYDWAILREAGLRLRLGQPVYLDLTGSQFWPGDVTLFYGPPVYAALALPLSFIDELLVRRLAIVVGVASVVVSAALLVGPVRTRLNRAALLSLAIGVVFSAAFAIGLIVTASSLLVLLLLAGASIGLVRRTPLTVGFCLGTAAALRIYPGVLFLTLVVGRRWRELGIAIGVLAGWYVVGVLVAGVGTTEQYMHLLVSVSGVTAPNNATVANLAAFAGVPAELLWVPRVASTVVGLGLLIVGGSRLARAAGASTARVTEATEILVSWGLAISGMLMVAPLAWEHYLTALLVLVVAMMARTGHARWGLAPVLLLPGWLGGIGLVLVPLAAVVSLSRSARSRTGASGDRWA